MMSEPFTRYPAHYLYKAMARQKVDYDEVYT